MKTKKQRQKWWKSLTPEKQDEYIRKLTAGKAQKRRQRSVNLMNQLGKRNDCKKCIHGVTKSCGDNLPRGCEYFYKVA